MFNGLFSWGTVAVVGFISSVYYVTLRHIELRKTVGVDNIDIFNSNSDRENPSLICWRPTSLKELDYFESEMLKDINLPFRKMLVHIKLPGKMNKSKYSSISGFKKFGKRKIDDSTYIIEGYLSGNLIINCIIFDDFNQSHSLNSKSQTIKSPNPPLFMAHGFAASLGLWNHNLEEIALGMYKQNRATVAFDWLGFGRSSRHPFYGSDPIIAECYFIESLEKFRIALGVEKFILMGHSFGGYLSICYAMKYPHRIEKLILVDPWGLSDSPSESEVELMTPKLPYGIRIMMQLAKRQIIKSPLAVTRAFGPLGYNLIKTFRGDVLDKYPNPDLAGKYIYHSIAHSGASGEYAFNALSKPMGYAKSPLLGSSFRMKDISKEIPLHFIFGSHSWIGPAPAIQFQKEFKDHNVKVSIMPLSSHLLYTEQARSFNRAIVSICNGKDPVVLGYTRVPIKKDLEHHRWANGPPPHKLDKNLLDQLDDGHKHLTMEDLKDVPELLCPGGYYPPSKEQNFS